LSEDDVGDPFAFRKLDEGVGDTRAFQLDQLCPELPGKADVVRQRHVITRTNTTSSMNRLLQRHPVF